MGRASFHAFIIHIPNPRGARSYNFMAGGSVATRCCSPSHADEAPAVGDAAKGSARRHLSRLQQFFRLHASRDVVERGCACELVNMHMCEARAVEQ